MNVALMFLFLLHEGNCPLVGGGRIAEFIPSGSFEGQEKKGPFDSGVLPLVLVLSSASGKLYFMTIVSFTLVEMSTKKRDFVYAMPGLLRNGLRELLKNDPLRMAGATSFFTTFALPPILVIFIQLFKLVFEPRLIRIELFKSLAEIVGDETARQLAGVLLAFRQLAQNWYITIAGFIFLVFVATTLFSVIKRSVNQLWKIKPDKEKGLLRNLRTRFHSVLVIVMAGILFIIGVLTEGTQAIIGKYVYEISPFLSVYFNSVLRHLVSIIMATVWFAMVFRYLPDGRPQWKIAFAGAFLTSLLFTVGKVVLHWLLTYSNINTLYGTSASIVLLLLFVFYSSLILYYGAAFTKIWGIYKKEPIRPLPHATHYRLVEAEVDIEKAYDEV